MSRTPAAWCGPEVREPTRLRDFVICFVFARGGAFRASGAVLLLLCLRVFLPFSSRVALFLFGLFLSPFGLCFPFFGFLFL